MHFTDAQTLTKVDALFGKHQQKKAVITIEEVEIALKD
jgi:hypothetical protein